MMYWDERKQSLPTATAFAIFLKLSPAFTEMLRNIAISSPTAKPVRNSIARIWAMFPKLYYNSIHDDIISAGMYSGHELDFD